MSKRSSISTFLSQYYLGKLPPVVELVDHLTEADASDAALSVTGDALIAQIFDAIAIRRSVLVTGPRGCGKSYCSDKAIRAATHKGLIGGWHFLQGNREIPRDYLCEDMLVIGSDAKPEQLRALALRPNAASKQEATASDSDGNALTAKLRASKEWPAILATEVNSAQDAASHWRAVDWTVLYLDEINRFSDGFLDSLLALTEEGKVVRRGQEYFVPLIVVATANPPGYDMTAKKLSPPLQARIARSYRVAQPTRAVLAEVIVPEALAKLRRLFGEIPSVPIELQYLAAAATLCLWGAPQKDKGSFFLQKETRDELKFAMAADRELRVAMNTISQLVTFGPDSRAVADWFGAATSAAVRRGSKQLESKDLIDTAVEVLAHKVRESFNEGTDPSLTALKETCVRRVVARVLTEKTLWSIFIP